jgi:hypothetical protein
MMRLQNVSTRRKDKINSDEEERLRLGYETQSGFRYAVYRGVKSHQTALVRSESTISGQLNYGHAATLWRINLGGRGARTEPVRLRPRHRTGYWQRNDLMPDDDDVDQFTRRVERVIPYGKTGATAGLWPKKGGTSVEVITSARYAEERHPWSPYQLGRRWVACELLPNGRSHATSCFMRRPRRRRFSAAWLKDPRLSSVARDPAHLSLQSDTGEDEATQLACPRLRGGLL